MTALILGIEPFAVALAIGGMAAALWHLIMHRPASRFPPPFRGWGESRAERESQLDRLGRPASE